MIATERQHARGKLTAHERIVSVYADDFRVDDVIDPADTRRVLIRALAMLGAEHAGPPARQHGNPPQ